MKNILKLAAAALLLTLINSCDIESPYLEVIQSKMTRDFLPNFKIEGFVSSRDATTGEPSLGIKLSWKKPNSDTRIMINVKTDSYPVSPEDGNNLFKDSPRDENEIIQGSEGMENIDFYYSIWILNDKDQPSGNPMHVSYRLNKETLSPEDIAQMESGAASPLIFNTSSDIEIGHYNNGTEVKDYRLLMKYNIFPHIRNIVDADIKMHCDTAGDQSIVIKELKESWDALSTSENYSTILSLQNESLNNNPYDPGFDNKDIFWDITSSVVNWADNPVNNNGILIEGEPTGTTQNIFLNDPGNEPLLTVYYGSTPDNPPKEYTATLLPYIEANADNANNSDWYPPSFTVKDTSAIFLLRFNFPENITLKSAVLNMYTNDGLTDVSFSIGTIDQYWDINTTDIDLFGLTVSKSKIFTKNFPQSTYYSWDLAEILTAWINNPDNVFGLKIYDTDTQISFDTTEWSDPGVENNPPKLTITYTR